MPKDRMSHDQARQKVCCVCTNLRGKKALRGVTAAEEQLVREHVLPGFDRRIEFFPSGVCKGCMFDLAKLERGWEEGAKVQLVLPEDYTCELPRSTRATATIPCSCRWCHRGRMNTLELRRSTRG